MLRSVHIVISATIALSGLFTLVAARRANAEGPPALMSLPEPVVVAVLPPDELVIGVDIDRGQALASVVAPFALQETALRKAARPHYDLSRIRPDRELQVRFVDGAAGPTELRYRFAEDKQLVLSREGGGASVAWAAGVEETPHTSRLVQVAIDVKGSMWRSLLDAGLSAEDFRRLAGIFKFAVDFNSELRTGDRLVLVADMWSMEGRPDRLATIHAIRLETHEGGRSSVVDAIRFEHADGSEDYYKPDGASLIKPFLRSPLEFYDVSSEFSHRRFHPILRVSRPHTGTDLVAPYGAPVLSVADGVVLQAGYNGSHGNYVEVRHDDVWTTSYSHLSRVAVRRGQKVSQGDRVGSVGATGLSTGTHLHYQMWKHGRFVDAMKVELPEQEPLDPSELPSFEVRSEQLQPLLSRTGAGVFDVPPEAVPPPPAAATPEVIAGIPPTSPR